MALLEKVQEINGLLRQELQTAQMLASIAKTLGCNIYLVSAEGEITGHATASGSSKAAESKSTLKNEFKQRLGFIFDITANLPLESSFIKEDASFQPETFMTIVPIRNTRFGSSQLLLTKTKKPFGEDELVLASTAGMVLCVAFYENDCGGADSESRQRANAQLVLDSLSFSEIKAISNVFADLKGLEGFLVASKIADRIGISRSVIVNAMRKLESAGVVESRSLGIKGTYIKIKNEIFLEILKDRVR